MSATKTLPTGGAAEVLGRSWRLVLAAVLLVSAGLRFALVERGGQFFFPDEARYAVSRDAAALIAAGKWKEGVDLALSGGDHVGFKLLGLAPALIEQATHRNPVIPALFLAACTLGSIVLLGVIARRLGASPSVQGWTVIAAATSAVLFYNARHLLPYDLSMALALLALALGLLPGGRRAALSGFVAGWAALSYYGYWPLVALVLAAVVILPAKGWLDFSKRAALAAAGALLAVALPIGLDAWWGKGTLIAGAKLLSASITAGDYRAHLVPWEYLWNAERFWFVAAVAAFGFAAWSLVRRTRAREWRAWRAPEAIALLGVLLLWTQFLVSANGFHSFVVHGRLVRQMTPFFALLLGWALSRWTAGRPRGVLLATAVLLAANAALTFGSPLALQFPTDFLARWAPRLKQASEQPSPDSYLRFVNVTHYIFEPEVLRDAPLETIAAAPHPYSFPPYLYEGFSPEERAQRRAVDHRMRLVRMAVPDDARVRGADYGVVRLELTLPAKRGGFIEPLVSIGPRDSGDVFFVRYVTDTLVQFGMESIGNVLLFSEPMAMDVSRPHVVECFSGSLLPAPGVALPADIPPRALSAAGRLVWMRLDGMNLLNEYSAPHASRPDQVYAGVNVANSGTSGSAFSGRIRAVRRGGLPPLPEQRAESAYGPIRIVCGPARGELGRPEPLLVAGVPEKAVLCYILPLENNTARFGVEIWGRGNWQSEPVALKPTIANEVVCSFGSLYPTVGSEKWNGIAAPDQRLLKRRVQVKVNGAVVLEFTAATPEWVGEPPPLAVGNNPVGGSLVLQKYLGDVGVWQQLPIKDAL